VIRIRSASMFLLAIVMLAVFTRPSFAADDRPNILVIYTDDHSHRSVSCYPEAWKWVNTPNIDRLAARGVRFAHAFVGTWCMPSRATLLTGHHQFGVESRPASGRRRFARMATRPVSSASGTPGPTPEPIVTGTSRRSGTDHDIPRTLDTTSMIN
jgi:hypothetical protein